MACGKGGIGTPDLEVARDVSAAVAAMLVWALWRCSLRFTLRTAEMTVLDARVRPLAGGVRVLAFLTRGWRRRRCG